MGRGVTSTSAHHLEVNNGLTTWSLRCTVIKISWNNRLESALPWAVYRLWGLRFDSLITPIELVFPRFGNPLLHCLEMFSFYNNGPNNDPCATLAFHLHLQSINTKWDTFKFHFVHVNFPFRVLNYNLINHVRL